MKKDPIKIKSKTIIKILFLIIVILISLVAYQLLYKSKPPTPDSTDLAVQEREELVRKVAKHIMLPESEIPTVATVSNADQLRSQPFFRNSSNGDKVLIYSLSKVAILYRPSDDRVIEKSKLNTDKNENNLTNGTTTNKN